MRRQPTAVDAVEDAPAERDEHRGRAGRRVFEGVVLELQVLQARQLAERLGHRPLQRVVGEREA
eukprot:3078804-Prymnesium_polylepis.1